MLPFIMGMLTGAMMGIFLMCLLKVNHLESEEE